MSGTNYTHNDISTNLEKMGRLDLRFRYSIKALADLEEHKFI